MDLYVATQEYLENILTGWDELDELLSHAVKRRPRHWRLPLVVCMSVGGDAGSAVPAVAALGSVYLGIILIDDMLDADPKGQHTRWGHSATSNMASALQSAGLEAIVRSPYAGNAKGLMLANLNQMMLQTAVGQYLDVQNFQDERGYWEVVRAKSSPFFNSCFYVGALAGGADEEMASLLGEIGGAYGEMVQLHDDINDVLEMPANPDWMQGRSPLPVLFAQIVDHPERERFCQLRAWIHQPGALAEAQQILIRCGAISYTIHCLLQRCAQAEEKLVALDLPQRHFVVELFQEVVAPIHSLFAQVAQEQMPHYAEGTG